MEMEVKSCTPSILFDNIKDSFINMLLMFSYWGTMSIIKAIAVFLISITIIISGCTEKIKPEKIESKKKSLKHKGKDLTLVAGGDFICARDFDKEIKKHGNDYFFAKAKEHFRNADITFANLECVVSDTAKLRSDNPKKINYNAPSTVIPAIKNSGFKVFSIANNHTYDLGSDGLKDFRRYLKQSNLLFGGAGKNYKEASKPVITQVNGLKIAFLFYNSTGTSFCSKGRKGGYNCMPFWKKKKALKILKKDLKKVKDANFVFLSIHWGKNYRKEPTEEQIEFAHAAIDSGVDAILGHSAHIFHGVEVYKNRPIIYDMGDVFLRKPDSWDTRSFFFNINVKESEIKSLELFPIFMNDTQIRFAEGMIAREINSRFTNLSKKFKTKITRRGNKIVIDMNQHKERFQKPRVHSLRPPKK